MYQSTVVKDFDQILHTFFGIASKVLNDLSRQFSPLSKIQKKSCHILALQQSDINQEDKIKQAYTKKMRILNCSKKHRTQLNIAQNYLILRLFQPKYSQMQIKLIIAISIGDLAQLKDILKNNPELKNFRTQNTRYPLLYLAVRSGHYEIVEYILKSGCSLNFINDKSTPMHCAAYYGHVSLIQLLLIYGISINIRNTDGLLPIDQAASQSIRKMIQNADVDMFDRLARQLIRQKIAITNFSINQETIFDIKTDNSAHIKKILLKNYKDNFIGYKNAFHGTDFEVFKSIAKHGLKKAGQIVDNKIIQTQPGHIFLQVPNQNIQDWANAIFVTPSICYAANGVYSKQLLMQRQLWLPVVQVKVKQNSYTQHNHTLEQYQNKILEPLRLQYRINCDANSHQISQQQYANYRNNVIQPPNKPNVIVVALMLIKKSFIMNNSNYQDLMNYVLKSSSEKLIQSKLGMIRLNPEEQCELELVECSNQFNSCNIY